MSFCKKSKNIAFVIAFMLVLLAFFSLTLLRAYADNSPVFIPSWEEYAAAGNPTGTYNDVANAIDDCIEASIKLYKAGDKEGAYTPALNIYNFYYETSGFERAVNGYSGSEVSKAELQFKTARKAVKKDLGEETVIAEFVRLSEILHIQANHLDGLGDTGESAFESDGTRKGSSSESTEMVRNESGEESAAAETDNSQTAESSSEEQNSSLPQSQKSGWVTFTSCFAIILREGLEAILVVGAIIAYLVKSGNKNKLKHVYLGCVLAIAASFLCAWLLSLLKLVNTANQEIIEGVTALTAVLVLFYVSNWMISKAEADTWNKYIDDQVQVSAETGSVFTLAFTAFLAVFREGAEVILFYQPLLSDAESMNYVWGGFIAGCVVLVFVFIAIRFFSVKLPIRPFFLGTSILMFVMSISFLGSGIKELIEGDIVDMTSPEWLAALIPFNDTLDVLGIYPVLETLIPQLVLIFVTLMIFVMQKFKTKNKNEAGILAILFGGLGGHKFYLGQYGRGLICVAFCWSFIPSLLGVIEGVHFLTKTQEQFEEERKPKPKKNKAPKITAAKAAK